MHNFITRLRKAEQEGAERQAAMEALILGWLKIRLRTKRCFSAEKP
jgi:hypothetical protein